MCELVTHSGIDGETPTVDDNGIAASGANAGTVEDTGIAGLRERAATLGGTVNLSDSPAPWKAG